MLNHNHSIISWAPSEPQAGNYGFNSKYDENLPLCSINYFKATKNEALQEKWDDDWKILQYLQPCFMIASTEEIGKKKLLYVDETPRGSGNQGTGCLKCSRAMAGSKGALVHWPSFVKYLCLSFWITPLPCHFKLKQGIRSYYNHPC